MIISEKHKETEILFLVEEADEGGYIARSLTYPIYTQADTLMTSGRWSVMQSSAILAMLRPRLLFGSTS